jgi:hypothetical protein
MWIGILVILFGVLLFMMGIKTGASLSLGDIGFESKAWIVVIVLGIILLAF